MAQLTPTTLIKKEYVRIRVIYLGLVPAGSCRDSDVGLTTMRRDDVKQMSVRRHLNIMRMHDVGCRKFASHAMSLFRLSHEMLLLLVFTEKRKKNLFFEFAKYSFLVLHVSIVKLICIFTVHNLIFFEKKHKSRM